MKLLINKKNLELIEEYSKSTIAKLRELSEKDVYDLPDEACDELLDNLDSAITEFGLVNQDYVNETGRALTKLYDKLFYQMD